MVVDAKGCGRSGRFSAFSARRALALTAAAALGGLAASSTASAAGAEEDSDAPEASERGTIDVGSAAVGVTVDRALSRLVPLWEPTINGAPMGSVEVAALLSTEAFADLYGASLGGSTSPENRYSIDGLIVNDPAFGVLAIPLPMEFASEVRAITGGMGADFGRTGGTAIEITTRSGSNEFRGSVWSSLVPGGLEGTREPPYREPQTIMTATELTAIGRLGADISGPILKDKLWFYAGISPFFAHHRLTRTIHRLIHVAGEEQFDAERGDLREEVPGTEKVYYADRGGLQYIGKLTYQLNEDHSASLSVFGSTESSGGDGAIGVNPMTGLVDARNIAGTYEAFALLHRATSNGLILRWASALLDDRLHLDARIGWHHAASSSLPADGSEVGSNQGLAGAALVTFRRQNPVPYNLDTFEKVPDNACATPSPFNAAMARCEVLTYSLGGPGYIEESTLNRYQGAATATALLSGLGRHVVKAGADIEVTSFGHARGYSGGRSFRESIRGTLFLETRLGYLAGPDDPSADTAVFTDVGSLAGGGFLRHDWSILDKVTLTTGVRLDAQALFDPRGRVGLALPAQVSPNAGLIYDFTGSGRSRLFVHLARRHPAIPVGLADSLFSDDLRLQATRRASACNPISLEGQKSEGCVGADSLIETSENAAEPSRRWRSSEERAVVLEDIDPPALNELVAGGEYEFGGGIRVGAHYIRRSVTTVIEDFQMDFDGPYRLGNPGGAGEAGYLPEATRDYDAGTLTFEKSFSLGWLAHASYTLSSLRGTWSGFYRPETAQLAPYFTEDFDYPYALANRDGPLPGDHTHRLRLFAAKEFQIGRAFAATAGLGYRGQSGGPTNIRASDIFGHIGELFIEPRGSGERLPWVHSIDARAGFLWRLGRERALHLEVTAWNLFNFQEVTATDENFTFESLPPGQPLADPFSVTPNPSFGKPTAYQAPRAVALSSRVDF